MTEQRALAPAVAWLREWWATLRYGSFLAKSGRTLRRNLHDDLSEYVEVERPSQASSFRGDRA